MALYKAFKELKSLVSPRHDSIDVIDTTFRLHKLTGFLLLGCTILISLKQYVGENIHCYHTAHIKDVMFESFCFITSTFSLPVKEINEHMASHPGVYRGDHSENDFNTFHNYYQWVPFVLFGQALAFYLPYQLWKIREGGKIKRIVDKLDTDPFAVPEKQQMEVIASYLIDNSGKFHKYAYTLFSCQVLNLLVVAGQIVFIHYFLGGQFLTYGITVISNASSYFGHMETVFPKVTKCTMETFGVTGKIVKNAGICVLPINVVNEKIYLFLYFWLIGLAGWTFFCVLYELALLSVPPLRRCFLRKRSRSVDRNYVREVLDNHATRYGDFIILRKLEENLESSQFQALFMALGEKLELQQRMGKEMQQGLGTDFVNKNGDIQLSKHDEENVENKILEERKVVKII